MKDLVKTNLTRSFPRLAASVFSSRARKYSQKLVRRWGLSDINSRLVAELGPVVQSGPFRGLKLTQETFKEHIGPYVLGTYEMELHSWIHEVINDDSKPAMILDVGSKFGYYAVGLAKMVENAEVFAFDTDWWARKATRRLAAHNGVNNVHVRGFCSPSWITNHLENNAFILSDCEGYEAHLFPPPVAKSLDSATLLIETHEYFSMGVTQLLIDRFSKTHAIEVIHSRPTTELPKIEVKSLSRDELLRAASEVRGSQSWLFMRPIH